MFASVCVCVCVCQEAGTILSVTPLCLASGLFKVSGLVSPWEQQSHRKGRGVGEGGEVEEGGSGGEWVAEGGHENDAV